MKRAGYVRIDSSSPPYAAMKDESRKERPPALDDATRRKMQNIRQRDTALEIKLRKELFRRGLRYRVHLRHGRCTIDIAFTKAKVAVMTDGCFWHACPRHATLPKNNREWWKAKLDQNVDRDRRHRRSLEADGWRVVRVWGHEAPSKTAERIFALLRRTA
jgi:DNA mismatch endonuclease (patch repair protein)